MRYIDHQQIYRNTNEGKDIFQYFFPNYEYGSRKEFIKLRNSEKTASAQITYYNNLWRITDFGNQQEVNSLDAISFVMWNENLNYYEALKFIEEVILRRVVEGSAWKRPQWRSGYEVRDMEPGDKKGEYKFVYKEYNEITEKDLEAIGRYVTGELLDEYNCRVVKHYEYCAFSKKKNKDVVHKFTSTEDYPIFVFDYGTFKKLYRPHDLEKKNRFSYVGDKPKNYIYGFKQLNDACNEFTDEENDEEYPQEEKPIARLKDIFRCSGESDALNLASLGFHVYWLNSESAELEYDEYKLIDDLCVNHYQIMDLDSTGKQMALKNALKFVNIFTVELPASLTEKKDFRGNPCKDLKDYINLIGASKDETKNRFIYHKATARKIKFWVKDSKTGAYNLNIEYFFFFLAANGFYKMDYRRLTKSNYCYLKIRDNVVDMIAPDDLKRIVKDFVISWIKSKRFMDQNSILNKLRTSTQISEPNMETLDKVEVNLLHHNPTQEFIHFKNGSLSITQDTIEVIKRSAHDQYILGSAIVKDKDISHILKRNISKPTSIPAISITATIEYQKLIDELTSAKTIEDRDLTNTRISMLPDIDRYNIAINDTEFIFTSFIQDLSRLYWRKEMEDGCELTEIERKEQNLTLINIMFCIGYLCAQYKHPAKPWIVLFQDTKESEVGMSSGRSGKSLLSSAIKYIRQVFWIDGRTLDKPDAFKFVFDGMTEFHDVIEVDDFAERGEFSYFYTQATGSRTVNCKHTSPFTLDYKDSGKLFMTTNFEMPNTDASTMSRLLPCGVSDYYHQKTDYNDYKETRSPDKKYGRQLYNDFTEDEWQKFYQFIAYCIQLQMRFEKITPPTRLLEKRQLRREMATGLGRDESFMQWASDYFKVWDGDAIDKPCISDKADGYVYLDTLFSKSGAYDHFVENSGISGIKKNQYSPQRFKKHIKTWAQYKGFEFNPKELCTDNINNRIIKNENGKQEEYIYIRTISGSIPNESNTIDTEQQLAF